MKLERSWGIIFFGIGLLLTVGTACHPFDPVSNVGDIRLIVNYADGSVLQKSIESLTSMRLVLMRKNDIIYDEVKNPVGGYFDFTVTGLDAQYRYNLFLEGMDNSSLSSVRGEAKGIEVIADEVTPVEVTLKPFYPQLIAPDSSASIDLGAIKFIWSKVYGARYYVLSVSKSLEFETDKIELTKIVDQDTSVTTNDLGRGSTYFWRVSCADSLGRGGKWSAYKKLLVY